MRVGEIPKALVFKGHLTLSKKTQTFLKKLQEAKKQARKAPPRIKGGKVDVKA